MKSENAAARAPVKEAFGDWRNLRLILVALFGLVAGQAVIWYAGQFYALFFLTQTLKMESVTASLLIALALFIGAPLIVFFGSLSDRVGRKPVILAGFLLATITYFPIFHGLTRFANPALAEVQRRAPVTLFADPKSCSFQFNPVGTAEFVDSCDIAKAFMTKSSVNYSNVDAPPGTVAYVQVGGLTVRSFEGGGLSPAERKQKLAAFETTLSRQIRAVGYPPVADPGRINYLMVTLMLLALVVLVAMVYGPIAAMLVELFPTRIRYTAMSLPYHIGNGWLGGFLPPTAFALVATTGDMYSGIWYPVLIAGISFIIGLLFLPETHHRSIA